MAACSMGEHPNAFVLMIRAVRYLSTGTISVGNSLTGIRPSSSVSFGNAALPHSRALESSQPVDSERARAHVDSILAAQNVTFPSVSARGMWNASDGGEAIVKVEIEVDGGPPPDGEPVRYYRMRYRPLSGWSVGGKTSAWVYRLKLF